MDTEGRSFSALLKEMRRQLALSQEDLARLLGVSYATVNRWENGQSVPSKLAKVQLKAFCEKMIERGKLTLSADMMDFADLGYFYKYTPPRPLEKIEADIKKIEKEIADMLAEVTE